MWLRPLEWLMRTRSALGLVGLMKGGAFSVALLAPQGLALSYGASNIGSHLLGAVGVFVVLAQCYGSMLQGHLAALPADYTSLRWQQPVVRVPSACCSADPSALFSVCVVFRSGHARSRALLLPAGAPQPGTRSPSSAPAQCAVAIQVPSRCCRVQLTVLCGQARCRVGGPCPCHRCRAGSSARSCGPPPQAGAHTAVREPGLRWRRAA